MKKKKKKKKTVARKLPHNFLPTKTVSTKMAPTTLYKDERVSIVYFNNYVLQ